MSDSYAASLRDYPAKGRCGKPERFDAAEDVEAKIDKLAELMRASKHTVVHTGAGISTAAGIPDFRGPNGVWTRAEQGKEAPAGVGFEEARPTYTHRALTALMVAGHVGYLVTQNVDGLHLKAGVPRQQLSEVHGNVFKERCYRCGTEVYGDREVKSVGLKPTGNPCPIETCRGRLRDCLLDWEDALPEPDHSRAVAESKRATLSICLGTSLQIQPCNSFPGMCRRNQGTVVIVNLQTTPKDRQSKLRIRARVDEVMMGVMKRLGVPVGSPDNGQVGSAATAGDADGGGGLSVKGEPPEAPREEQLRKRRRTTETE